MDSQGLYINNVIWVKYSFSAIILAIRVAFISIHM